ncbi:MAG: GDP-mannose 4,6-dehydratase [Ignavibacteria bacterium]|nr:GDP-mannose 4,6-dehydratase [Ignavibacteria bacterium]
MDSAKNKTALITGITGQDGSYLAEFLLGKSYRVVGLCRHRSAMKVKNLNHLVDKVEVVECDLSNSSLMMDLIRRYQPDEIYNLASQSFPGESWHKAIETGEITGLGAHRLFEAVRQTKPDCRVFQASSSEIFGAAGERSQNERTQYKPVNPYGAAKLYAHSIARMYAESLDMFIARGILFNHESPRRGIHFLTQKVAYGAACISLGIKNSLTLNEQGEPIVADGKISLGNLDARRDWGFAGDYVEAMWLMLQQDKPDEFVIGTGQSHTVREFCSTAFGSVGLTTKDHLRVDQRFLRPAEASPMIADASKAKDILGWTPKTSFTAMVEMMVNYHVLTLRDEMSGKLKR